MSSHAQDERHLECDSIGHIAGGETILRISIRFYSTFTNWSVKWRFYHL